MRNEIKMDYKRIKNKKIYEEVGESIIDMIRSKELKPGDKLDSVKDLAVSFEVSQSTVREALSGLRSMGIIEMKQGQGTYIKTFDSAKFSLPVTTAFLMKQDDVKELYELRKILEVGTASLAAEVRKEEDLVSIEKALVIMKNASENEDLAASADTDFHIAIVHATHNELLTNLIANVRNLISETIHETRRVLHKTEGNSEKLYEEHEGIFQAIKNKEPDLARELMYKHLDRVNKELFNYIDQTME